MSIDNLFSMYLVDYKKILLLTYMVMLSFTMHAQKINATRVPAAVKAAFAKQYPTAIAKWVKENGDYEAGFKMDGKEMSALFAADGTMTESEVSIKPTDLPAKVLAYVKANYKDKKIKGAAKITKADASINYEAEVNGIDVMFDADGKFLKEVKE
jgi:Putative beta-lactamase-inhibitor-like, PepSY-like